MQKHNNVVQCMFKDDNVHDVVIRDTLNKTRHTFTLA